MDWYYAENGQQKGPVSDEQLQSLVRDGVVKTETLVWRDGLANWQRHGEITGAPAATPSLPPLVAPAVSGGGGEGETIAEDYEPSLRDALAKGFKPYAENMVGSLGASIIYNGIKFVMNHIPILGLILGLVLGGPLFGGFWLYFLHSLRDQPVQFGTLFNGFGPLFVQLMIGFVVSVMLPFLFLVPGLAIIIIAVIFAGLNGGSVAAGGVVLLGLGVFVLGLIPAVILWTNWMFTVPLVADKQLEFWPAMQLSWHRVRKHWWSNLGLVLPLALLVIVPIMIVAAIATTIMLRQQQFDLMKWVVLTTLIDLIAAIWLSLCSPFVMSSLSARYELIFGELKLHKG